MQVLWSVVLGLAMVFPSTLNMVKTDDRCVNGWSVPVGWYRDVMDQIWPHGSKYQSLVFGQIY